MLSKCKEYFCIRVITSRINYLLLFVRIKWVIKKRLFSKKKPLVFSWAFHFETHKSRRSPYDVPSPMAILPTQEQIISFLRKILKINCFKLTSKQLFFKKCKIKGQPLFFQVTNRAHLGAMTSWRWQHYVQKENWSFLDKKGEYFLQWDNGAFCLPKVVWSFKQITPNVFSSESRK
jgi:hypothetical protein